MAFLLTLAKNKFILVSNLINNVDVNTFLYKGYGTLLAGLFFRGAPSSCDDFTPTIFRNDHVDFSSDWYLNTRQVQEKLSLSAIEITKLLLNKNIGGVLEILNPISSFCSELVCLTFRVPLFTFDFIITILKGVQESQFGIYINTFLMITVLLWLFNPVKTFELLLKTSKYLWFQTMNSIYELAKYSYKLWYSMISTLFNHSVGVFLAFASAVGTILDNFLSRFQIYQWLKFLIGKISMLFGIVKALVIGIVSTISTAVSSVISFFSDIFWFSFFSESVDFPTKIKALKAYIYGKFKGKVALNEEEVILFDKVEGLFQKEMAANSIANLTRENATHIETNSALQSENTDYLARIRDVLSQNEKYQVTLELFSEENLTYKQVMENFTSALIEKGMARREAELLCSYMIESSDSNPSSASAMFAQDEATIAAQKVRIQELVDEIQDIQTYQRSIMPEDLSDASRPTSRQSETHVVMEEENFNALVANEPVSVDNYILLSKNYALDLVGKIITEADRQSPYADIHTQLLANSYVSFNRRLAERLATTTTQLGANTTNSVRADDAEKLFDVLTGRAVGVYPTVTADLGIGNPGAGQGSSSDLSGFVPRNPQSPPSFMGTTGETGIVPQLIQETLNSPMTAVAVSKFMSAIKFAL